MILYPSFWKDLVKILLASCKRSLRDLSQILMRRSRVLVKSFLRGPCMILYTVQALNRRSCGDPGETWGACRCHVVKVFVWKLLWEALVSRSCQIRSSSSKSFYDDLVKSVRFSYGSWHEDLAQGLSTSLCEGLVEILVKCCQRPLHDLVQVLVRISWRGPDEILPVCLHDLVQVLENILLRSCWNPA